MILAVIQSSILVALALCAVRLLRGKSAATRHAILAAGLAGSLVAPFLGAVLPGFPVLPGKGLYTRVQVQTEILPDASPAVIQSSAESTGAVARRDPFLWIWFIGMAAGAIVLVSGAWRITWLVSRSTPAGGDNWVTVSREITQLFRLNRSVRLLQNDHGVLGTWGVVRPKVLVPQQADRWPESRIRLVLLHELAHIKRFDWPLQMLAEFARTVYWFNPLFWLVCRGLRAESEHACDDVVLSAGVDAKDYAADLLDLARTLNNSSRTWSSVLAMSRPPNLERRFVAMLNPSLNHRSLTRAAVFVICLLALCVTVPVSAMRPAQQPQESVSLPRPSQVTETTTSKASLQIASSSAPKARVSRRVPRQGLADGSLWGTVYDATGAVVPGVRVTIANERIAEQVATGSAGEFEFRALPAGRYFLTAELRGFAIANVGGIEVKSSQVSRQNVTLSVGSIAERVQVSAAGQPKPPAPPGTPLRIRVGGNVQAANLISQVRPIYPQTAHDAGIEGTVHMQGIIGADGTLIGLRVIRSNDPGLAAAAFEAVRQWRYRPTLLNNDPVEVITEIDVDFKLVQ